LGKDLSAGRGKFCEIFSIKCALRWGAWAIWYRTKRASLCKKRSKTFENI
jgi:hypothetical protein